MISYEPLFKTMKDKNISTYELIIKRKFPKSVYYSIKAGNPCSTNTINTLCELLDCDINDIMKYIPTKDKKA